MSVIQTQHYVGLNDQGLYWAGYNTWTDQLRKAKLYNSLKYAQENIQEAVKRSNQWLHPPINSYKILTVELVVVSESEEFLA